MPNAGDELHHFGWNACSACLCPHAPHPHGERRYLVVPGIHSSRIHIIDTKPDPRKPQIVKVIEPETLAARTGYASPHTVHCGPDGILIHERAGISRRRRSRRSFRDGSRELRCSFHHEPVPNPLSVPGDEGLQYQRHGSPGELAPEDGERLYLNEGLVFAIFGMEMCGTVVSRHFFF